MEIQRFNPRRTIGNPFSTKRTIQNPRLLPLTGLFETFSPTGFRIIRMLSLSLRHGSFQVRHYRISGGRFKPERACL